MNDTKECNCGGSGCDCKCGGLWWIFPAFAASVLVILFVFSRFASFPLSLTSTVTQKMDTFQVTGEGKVMAKPDTAQISIGVTKAGPSINSLQNEVNTITNKVITDLRKLGTEEKYIKTTSYNLSPNYDWSQGKQRITGYTISLRIEVTTKNLDKVNEIIDTATEGGANELYELNLTLDEERRKTLAKEAREGAIKEAKTKAIELARASGMSLGKIINISENLYTPWEPSYYNYEKAVPAAGGGGEPTQIQPGETEVRVSVTLSYEIR